MANYNKQSYTLPVSIADLHKMAFPTAALLALAAILALVIVRASRRKSLKFLRGPDAPSRWLGG